DLEGGRIGVTGKLAKRLAGGPGGPVQRPGPPPRPDLLRGERQERREQPDLTSRVAGSASPASSRNAWLVGQAARCSVPVRHHDQTSSVANGRNGANSQI